MLNWADPQTFWLNVTNAALGLVCLTSLVLILGAVVKEVWARAKKHNMAIANLDPHILSVPELGTTMADGGQPLSEKPDKKMDK